jgi:hypothetical protein
MHSNRIKRAARAAVPALLTASCLAMSPTHALDQTAVTRYRQDRAVCDAGASPQDLATCRKEAGAALQAARQGTLSDQGTGRDNYAGNALARCGPLPEAERADCFERMLGKGTVSGSVAGGGLLRELTTTTVIVPATTQ